MICKILLVLTILSLWTWHTFGSLPTLVDASPNTTIFNESFTLVCQVSGIPLPLVTWDITNSLLSIALSEQSIRRFPNSLFSSRNVIIDNKVHSSLFVNSVGLCLGTSNISCVAKDVDSNIHIMHTFEVNSVSYQSFEKKYVVFSRNTSVTENTANSLCNDLGGNLVTIPDNSTQVFLEKTIDDLVSKNQFFSGDTWTGLKKLGDKFVWSNGQDSSYANWEKGFPQINDSCVYMDANYKWKTHACLEKNLSSAFTALYICEKIGYSYPSILRITSPLHNGNSSLVHIMWNVLRSMRSLRYKVKVCYKNSCQMKYVVPMDVINDNGTVLTTFHHLKPAVEHSVQISLDLSACVYPIVVSKKFLTSLAYIATIRHWKNSTCLVTWIWPKTVTVNYFTVNITKQSFFKENRLDFVNQSDEVKTVILQTNVISYQFATSPNHRYYVKISEDSSASNNISIQAKGSCENPPIGPWFVPKPRISIENNGALFVKLDSVDDSNGSISCYFVMVQYNNARNKFIEYPINTLVLKKISMLNSFLLSDNIPYLALALNRNFENISIRLGDGTHTTCNVTSQEEDSSNNSVTFRGINFPLQGNKYYKFVFVTATYVGEGKTVFTVSKPVVQYVSQNYTHIIYIATIAFIALALLGAAIYYKFIHRHGNSMEKRSGLIMFERTSFPSELFENLQTKLKSIKISHNHIEMLDLVNDGVFCQLWNAKLTNKKYPVEASVKIINGFFLNPRKRRDYSFEIELMSVMGYNEFVLQLLGISSNEEKLLVITEPTTVGELRRYLISCRPCKDDNRLSYTHLGTKQMAQFALDVAAGMQFLVEIGLVHRDLAARNILLNEKLQCKIAGLASAREVNESDQRYVGPENEHLTLDGRWLAPEAFFDRVFTSFSDVWSFGVLMWEIFAYGYTPYKDLGGKKLVTKVMNHNYRLNQPKHCSDAVYEMMGHCWNLIPPFRPSFEDFRQDFLQVFKQMEDIVPTYESIHDEDSPYKDISLPGLHTAID